ncbi:Hypothetical protein NCS54_00956500 [Fusarium falciforme]|uniref:Hypothetical protein n=1 Tax=Fusarium falciforme TaxID=195108 RepID=UPI002301F6C0|nr:Hypothetical protein NCS54_00956500 [Fusarium falciforme]WAO92072.1 Hypothetical protein NCS54_00956500 [Fusarium falciforme]
MVASVNGTPRDPPTETSNPANPTSITPGIPDFASLKSAIQQGNIEVVRALVEKGADVNSWLPGKGTVLQIALEVAEPQIECIRMLLDNGANIYSKGDTFGNALTRAVDKDLDDVLDLMVQGGYVRNEAELPPDQRLGDDMTILHVAVCCRNRRALKRLLESPAKEMIDHQDSWRRTPLHYATKTYREALDWVQACVDINPKGHSTPGSTECEIAQVLVDNGARADISDALGSFTALQNSFRNFTTYDLAKIVFPAALVNMSRLAETTRYVLERPEMHILYNETGGSLITTSELEASETSELTFTHFLLFQVPTKRELNFNKTSLLILGEHQRLITEKRGLSFARWNRAEATPSRDARWKLHRGLMPTRSEFETFRNDSSLHDFIACRFITTYPRLCPEDEGDTQQDSTSIELVRRSHVLLWTMVGECHEGWDGTKYTMLKSTALITTSPHAEPGFNVCNLLDPLLQTLREEWMLAFKTANDHQFKMRSIILKSRGNDHRVIDCLLEDALSWVQVEEIANEQRRDLSELNALFVGGQQWKPHERKIPLHDPSDFEDLERFGVAVSEFCEYLATGVKNLRDTSQELIGLEFNLTSINEAQKSTSTSVSMKRLSWITFIFLPLTFVSSLFGMNVNVLESNPPWWIYLPFAFATLGLTMVVWLTFKRYPSIEDKAERVFRKLAS